MVAFYARYAPLGIPRFLPSIGAPKYLAGSSWGVGWAGGRFPLGFLCRCFSFLSSLFWVQLDTEVICFGACDCWCLISLSVSTGTRVIDGGYWARCFESDRLRPSNASFSASFSALYVMVVCWGFALSVQSTKSQYSALQIGLSASLTRLIEAGRMASGAGLH